MRTWLLCQLGVARMSLQLTSASAPPSLRSCKLFLFLVLFNLADSGLTSVQNSVSRRSLVRGCSTALAALNTHPHPPSSLSLSFPRWVPP